MKSINKIIATAVLLLTGGATAMPADIGPAVTEPFAPGGRRSQNIEVVTPEGATAIQFTMTLPDGFSLSSKSLTLDKTRAKDHLYRMNEVEEGRFRCVIYSNSNTPFAKTDGGLFSVPLKAAATTPTGDFPLEFSEVTTSDAQGNETSLADATISLPVRIQPTGITVSPSSVDIFVGEEVQLNATVTPAGADQSVIWEIPEGSRSYFTIDETGKLTGLAGFNPSFPVTVTVRSAVNSSIYQTFKVIVRAIPVSSVTIDQASLTLRKGENSKLTATVLPENAADKSITWSSSSSSIVYVNSSTGEIEARRIGTATITATSKTNSSIKATCQVTVIEPLTTKLMITPSSVTMTIGDSRQFSLIVSPSDANPAVKWSVSDSSLAHIDENGQLTALAAGSVTVTATATDGSGISASSNVTINRPQGTSVNLSKTAIDLRVDEETTLIASVVPATANNSFIWKSSNTAVATVSVTNGSPTAKIIAKGAGTAFISATTTDGSNLSAQCAVTVRPPLVSGITLSATTLTMSVGDGQTLKSTVSPSNADATLEWSSSNEAVATVDNSGHVTAVGLGNAIITARATDGSGKSATCSVNVNFAAVTSLTLDRTTLTITQSGSPVRLIAIVKPDYATQKTLNWVSSNSKVATVGSDGTVTPVAPGVAVITVRTTDGSNLQATCNVTIVADAAGAVTVNPATVTLEVDQTYKLTATISPATAPQAVLWSSSNQSVAIVSSDGLVKAIGDGSAIITATAADGSGISGSCIVEVLPVKVEEIILNVRSLEMSVGDSSQLSATVKPDNAKVKDIDWFSSNENVVTVDDTGLVTAMGLGTASIIAKAFDGSEVWTACSVNVNFAAVTSLTLDHTTLTIAQSDSPVRLIATVEPDYASQKTLNWTSDNNQVATVSADGTVTPVAPGMAVITARTTDGSNLQATCNVTVVRDAAGEVVINPATLILEINQSYRLTASVSPSTAPQEVIWASSDMLVATVGADGTVNAISDGTAVITATTADGSGVSSSCVVEVLPAKVEEIILSVTSLEMNVGDSSQLSAMVKPDYAKVKTVEWNSSAPQVVSVDSDGNIAAIGVGTATITATAADGSGISATCEITVSEVIIPEIKVEQILIDSAAEMEVGTILTLSATVLPDNADNPALEWKSSKPEVATVSQDGKVFGLEAGVTLITVSATDGSSVSAYCLLTVKDKDSSIQTVNIGDKQSDCIYNLTGRKVKNPVPGIYIVNGKKTVIK